MHLLTPSTDRPPDETEEPRTPARIAANIMQAWESYVSRGAHPMMPHESVYASSWRSCERRMVLEMTQPDAMPPWSAEMRAKFRRGDDRERDILIDLARVGRDSDPSFSVIGQQQRIELKDRKGRKAIVGKVDAMLDFGHEDRNKIPLEVKSWSQMVVDRIETFEDLFASPWTRSGAYQLLSYLYGHSVPYGFMLLDRSGLPSLLPVELLPNLERVEEFLARAERALDHRAAGTLPEFYDDPAECQRCPFYGSVCNPPLSHASAVVLTDPELEALLVRREALKTAGTEYARLDRDAKQVLRGVETGVAGQFLIKGKWAKQTKLELPDEIRKQYTTTDDHGRFTLEITQL